MNKDTQPVGAVSGDHVAALCFMWITATEKARYFASQGTRIQKIYTWVLGGSLV